MVLKDRLFHHILFLLFFGCRQSHFLLALVVHHLLDETSRLSVQVGQLRRFGIDLFRVDLRIGHDQTTPPLHLVHLLQSDEQRCLVLDQPRWFLNLDVVQETIVHHGRHLVFQASFQMILLDVDCQVARTKSGLGQRDPHLNNNNNKKQTFFKNHFLKKTESTFLFQWPPLGTPDSLFFIFQRLLYRVFYLLGGTWWRWGGIRKKQEWKKKEEEQKKKRRRGGLVRLEGEVVDQLCWESPPFQSPFLPWLFFRKVIYTHTHNQEITHHIKVTQCRSTEIGVHRRNSFRQLPKSISIITISNTKSRSVV